jgi:hypothetical protein
MDFLVFNLLLSLGSGLIHYYRYSDKILRKSKIYLYYHYLDKILRERK